MKLGVHSWRRLRLLAGERETRGSSNKLHLVPEKLASSALLAKEAGNCGAKGSLQLRLERCCAVAVCGLLQPCTFRFFLQALLFAPKGRSESLSKLFSGKKKQMLAMSLNTASDEMPCSSNNAC